MSLLLFSSSPKGAGKRLQRLLEVVLPGQKSEIIRTISDLSARLLQPLKCHPNVVILVSKSKEELSELLSIRDLLDDVRIILVLPDRERDTVSKGHILRPRFLTYIDSHFQEIAAVLNKILATSHPAEKCSGKAFEAVFCEGGN